MKLTKRLLAMLLCLVLIFSMVPPQAFSATEAPQEETVVTPVAQPDETGEPEVITSDAEKFVFQEPGKAGDEPVGEVIKTERGYRVQRNPDLQSWTILEYLGSASNVVIPGEYNGLPITRIASYAFRNKIALRNVQISENIARIEPNAFDGCSELTYHGYEGGKYLGSETNAHYYYCGPEESVKETLTEATMHPDTKIVAGFAFRGCEQLRSVVVPDGVKQVGYGMVQDCDLESITLPFVGELGTDKNPQFGWTFGARSFGGNISYVPLSLKKVVITGGVDGKQGTIAQGAFYGVDMIEELTLPFLGGSVDNTTNAFISYYWGASSYKENILPACVKSVTVLGGNLGVRAFYSCNKVDSVTLGNLGSVGSYILDGCDSLVSVTILGGVSSVNDYAFYNCSGLTDVTILPGAKKIGNYAFYGCSSLTSITIPDSVISIGKYAFQDCSSLRKATIGANSRLTSIGSNAFYGCSSLTGIVIPDGVISIGIGAFYDCSSLREATIGINSQLTTIEGEVFYGCSSLTGIVIPDGVTSLGTRAFGGCSSLREASVGVNSQLTTIGIEAFYGCSRLTSFVIPNGVTSIDSEAFFGCSSLTGIVIPDSVISIGKYAFCRCYGLCSVTFGENSHLSAIGSCAFYGCSRLTGFVIPNGVTSIQSNAFFGCSSLTSIAIPDGVTSIDSNAFYGCSSLTSITIPDSVTSIGSQAFHDCCSLKDVYISDLSAWCNIEFSSDSSSPLYYANNLYLSGDLVTELVIPDGVTTIGDYTFRGFSNLTGITIPDGVTSIGDYAFQGCSNLTGITLPNGITSIGTNAFSGCSSLISIVIPDSVISIGGYAFSGCKSLTSITIPDGVTAIANYAFYDCSSLTSITIPNSITTVGSYAFSGCGSMSSLTFGANSQLTSVGEYAFEDCARLNSVVIPDTVTSLGKYAFYNCSGLLSINIPANAKTIGNNAFYGCNRLYAVTNNSTLKLSIGSTSYGYAAYYAKKLVNQDGSIKYKSSSGYQYIETEDGFLFEKYNTRYTLIAYLGSADTVTLPETIEGKSYSIREMQGVCNVVIPEGIKTISASAFKQSSLASIVIPDGVTTIGDSAFYGCSNLTSITIPDSVTSIGSGAFSYCSSLTSITIPESITFVDSWAFFNCISLEEVRIGDLRAWCNISFDSTDANPLFYAKQVLLNGVAVREIEIPAEVTEIKESAFYAPYALDKVVLPDSAEYLRDAFSDNLVVDVKATNSKYQLVDDALYDKTAKTLIRVPSFKVSLSWMDGVTSISPNAFYGCDKMTSITIPDSVTSIGSNTFYNCNSLTGITIPDSVTSIGSGAFSYCSSLTSITIPDSVTSISYSAFSNCSGLTSVAIPDSVTSIGNHAFSGCSSLTSIVIPNGVTTIGNYAFKDCSSLTSITIPDSVTSIGYSAFSGCSSLTNITIPDSVTTIGDSAFSSCRSLTSITIPNSVTSIDRYAFSGCSSLTSITIPDGVTSIGDYAFSGCESLEEIAIQGSVAVIKYEVFRGCKNLKSIVLREGVSSIESRAFADCTGLESVSFPGSLTSIAADAFPRNVLKNVYIGDLASWCQLSFDEATDNPLYSAENIYLNGSIVREVILPDTVTELKKYVLFAPKALDQVTISKNVVAWDASALSENTNVKIVEENQKYQNIDGVTYDKPATKILAINADYAESITIPDGVTDIGTVFNVCGRLTGITIPASVSSIGTYAFYGCSNLTRITISNGVTTIGNYAFQGCSSLTSITIPDSVTAIGRYAFSGCSSLPSIIIPGSVKTIEDNTFENCTGIEDVKLRDGVTTINSSAFYGCSKLISIAIPDSVTSIGSTAFEDCSSLTSITIPGGVTTIGNYAFYDCSRLTSVAIPDGVTSIGSYAFANCSSLTSIVVPDSVTSIGSSAFYRCNELTSIVIPNGVTSIGSSTFYNCNSLESIVIPGSVTSIGSDAFQGCSGLNSVYISDIAAWCNVKFNTNDANPLYYAKNLYIDGVAATDIVIPAGVTVISSYAFYGRSSLTSVTIPDSVTTIGDYAFYGCSGLTNIVIPNSVTSIKNYAFGDCSKLLKVAISSNVKSIGSKAFYGCNRLYAVTNNSTLKLSIGSTSYGYAAYYAKKLVNQDGSIKYKSSSGYQYIETEDGFLFEKYNTRYTLIAYLGSADTVTLPETIEGTSYSLREMQGICNVVIPEGIKTISASAFKQSTLASIVIPDGVTAIGDSAFYDCSSLTSITIPGGVTTIGDYVFCGCSSLTSITIPDGVTSVGGSAFSGCSSLTSITIPDGMTSIGSYAFSDCSSLTSITIPDGVTSVGDYAFSGCSSLSSIVIPSSVKTIGDGAFKNCTGIEEFKIPDRVTSIGGNAFSGCSNLTSVVIPDSVIAIGGYAFSGCKSLTSITIPKGVTVIEGYMFNNCSRLESVKIEGSVALRVNAFANNAALRTVEIAGVRYIEDSAFVGCPNLTRIVCNCEANEWRHTVKESGWDTGIAECELVFAPDTGILYETNEDKTEFYIAGVSEQFTAVTPSERYSDRPVVAVLSNAFSGNQMLEAVTLPETVIYIGENAFANCSGLRDIKFPTGLAEMDRGILTGCTSLEELNLPFLGMNAADDKNAYLAYTFGGYSYSDNAAYVPEGLTVLTVNRGTQVIAHAFDSCASLRKINLPDTITQIGDYAFAGCADWVPNPLPDTLEKLGAYAFSGCTSIVALALPEKLTEIQSHTFSDCVRLEQLQLPDTITQIGDYAFSGCVGLKQLPLPGALEKIGSYAFSGCSGIQEITLPEKLTQIGDYGFRGCESLKSLRLPDSVTKVGVMLLDGCNRLTAITIGAGLGYDGIADTHNKLNGNPFLGIDKSASRLSTYTVATGNQEFMVEGKILYRKMVIDGKNVPVEVVDAPAKANLSSYQLPEGVVKIGAYAFAYNNTLQAFDMEYVRMVGNHAFYKAENLLYADFAQPLAPKTLPENVEAVCYNQYVGKNAFTGCKSLKRVAMGSEMLLGVDEEAFADCPSLTTVDLGKKIRYIGIGAFGSSGSSAPALKNINVHSDNPYFESIDGVLYQQNEDGTYTLLVYPAMSDSYTQTEDGKKVFFVPSVDVTGIESYAFRMAQHLDEIYLEPRQEMRVGDYAFANTMMERVYVGENVVSLGLKRGEGEYTLFADCNELVAIEVEKNNRYYSSQDGVLFDKNATRLIKYPKAKGGNLYTLPDTVRTIASMAFKNNNTLEHVHICSQVDTVGMEAFYGCTSLSLIFFDGVYAPTSILENAFTTYDSLNETHVRNPRTQLGYSQGYYLDGLGGQYGWSNYGDVYNIALCEALPESEGRSGNDFYAIVVVDSQGNRVDGMHVTLTDPSGVAETVTTGEDGAATGVAVFYDLFSSTGMGFSMVFDGTYTLKVADPTGEYFTYVNPAFYLDKDMRITYVTMAALPSIYGTTCGETDINTESAEINKAEYGYTTVELVDPNKGYVEGNLKTYRQSEYLDISVIAYCDGKSGWSFVDEKGQVLDAGTAGLYQNGIKLCDVSSVLVQEDSVIFTFRADVTKLIPEVQIEAKLKAFGNDAATFVCSTILNIHVFDFLVTEDDVHLDTQEVELDLSKENELLAKLMGGSKTFKLGKNMSFGVAVDGSRVEMTLGANYQKSKEKGKVGNYASYEQGYKANHEAHNKNTYFFQYHGNFKDQWGVKHSLTFNVRFARGTEESNYFYYRCYVYEDYYENEVATFYGAVNGLNDTAAKLVGAKTYRARVAPKAWLIYKSYLDAANKQSKAVKDIKELGADAKYIEAIDKTPAYSNSHAVEAALSGKLIFEYDRKNGIKPVSTELHGELYYTFKHNSQFVVWVIPITLEVEVKLGGEVDIKLKVDKDRGISMEEVKLTLGMTLSAQLGVGCSVASAGAYGNIGVVFIVDFYPEVGIDSWSASGEIGAYVKVWRWKKSATLAEFDKGKTNQARKNALAALYIAENYSSADLDDCDGTARIIFVGDQIYRISYLNTESLAGYDAYNCRKLAVSQWNDTQWSKPVILDDCKIDGKGRDDVSYDLYADGEKLYVVYTQQGQYLDQASVDDPYVSSANMVIKMAEITDLSTISVTTVTEGDYYKYLPTITKADGTLTAAWVENTDNNMFGVSPYNYIDGNGESHVFETTANTVYVSKLTGGQWQTPETARAELSAVTDLAIAESGVLAYVVDSNGDLGDSEDRVLYTLDSGLQNHDAVNDLAAGSVTGVDADGMSFVYYYSSAGEEPSGLRSFGTDTALSQQLAGIESISDSYKLLRDDKGELLAVFYVAPKIWQEADETVDGSAMYAIFRNDGQWGLPVEIREFPVEPGVYISSFDVLYRDDASVMAEVEFVNKEGAFRERLTESDICLEDKLSVVEHQVDYVNRTLEITVKNDGAKPGEVFTSIGSGERTAYTQVIGSGETQTIIVSLRGSNSMQPVVNVYDSAQGAAIHTIDGLDLNYSDVVPFAKQLLLGKDNNLLLGVKNTGVLNEQAYLVVRPGNYDAQTICGEDLLSAAKNQLGGELSTGAVVPVLHETYGLFWVIKADVPSGSVQHYEVSLEAAAYTNEAELFSIYAMVESENEKGTAAQNNMTYVSYQQLTGVLGEGQEATATAKLQADSVEFDGKTATELCVGFSCGADNTIQSVSVNGVNLVAQTDYSVEMQTGTGSLTIFKSALEALSAGTHQVSVTFATGETCTLVVTVPKYYTITWMVDGTQLCTTEVKHGAIPHISSNPTKDSGDTKEYAFLGWSAEADENNCGIRESIGIRAAVQDATYYAVWGEDSKIYKITWVFENKNGQMVSVVESYAYNKMPEFMGTILTPDGKVFAGWDKEVVLVAGDAVYTAVYKKPVVGSAIVENTAFETAGGMTFTTTLLIRDVADMNESTLRLCFDETVVEFVSVALKDDVLLLEQGDGYLVLKTTLDATVPVREVAELTFMTKTGLSAGEKAFLSVVSEDTYTAQWNDVAIRFDGDLNGDGKVNTRDLAILRQYVCGITELTEVQLIYANVNCDYQSDGSPKINTRDIDALQQMILDIPVQ